MFKISNDVLEQLQKLRDIFIATLPEKLTTIDRLWQAVKQQGDSVDELYLVVHSLTGSAGTFGHQQLSDAARHLEQILQPHLSNTDFLTATTIRAIETELNKLKELVYK